MYRSGLILSGVTRLQHGSGAGWMRLELAFWILGIALIATYLAATTTLENQRTQGIELFAEARAMAMLAGPVANRRATNASARLQDRQAGVPTPIGAGAIETPPLPIAVLRMDRVGLEVPIYPDISELNLSRGAGWIGGTAAPNTGGNVAVAAHRDRYFRPLKDVKVGDILELESLSGRGEFRVSRIVIVDPTEVSVLDDTTVPTVTLVTCYPFYFIGNAPRRYIVQAIAVDQSGEVSSSDAILTALPSGETP